MRDGNYFPGLFVLSGRFRSTSIVPNPSTGRMVPSATSTVIPGDAFLYAVTPARVCDMWNVKQESDSHYSFPPPRNALIAAAISPISEFSCTFIFASIAPSSAPRFSQSRVRCLRRLYKELSSFGTSPLNVCNVFGYVLLVAVVLFQTRSFYLYFLLCIRY